MNLYRLFTLSIALCAVLSAAQGATYTYARISPPGALSTGANDLNDSGEVVGYYYDGNFGLGYLYSNGTYTTLGLSPRSTSANALNDSGEVVGSYLDIFNSYGFLYSNGTYTILEPPGAPDSVATALNDSGEVVGYSFDIFNSGSDTVFGYLYSNGTYTTLAPPGAQDSYANDLNDSGEVVGRYSDGVNTFGFLYSNGTYTTLAPPGAQSTSATALNDSGEVVGDYSDGVKTFGFLATPTEPPVITSNAPPAGTVGTAYSFTYAATGTAPISYSVSTGALPPGLTLSSAGVLSGTPTTAGTFTGTVTASNGTAPNASQGLSITIAEKASSGGGGGGALDGFSLLGLGLLAWMRRKIGS
jgi:hypothetical protein